MSPPDYMETLAPYEGISQRIDSYLASTFPYSRNFFHHIIKRGGVQVNQQIIKKSYKLQKNDVITIDDLQRYVDPIILAEAPDITIPILYETDDIMVINKPKGVLSHPNSIRDVQSPSVVGFLYHRYKDLPTMGSFIRAGIVHRLDKQTDGCMMIAKSEKGLQHLRSLFHQKSTAESIHDKQAVPLHKFYRAKCYITKQGAAFVQKVKTGQQPYYIDKLVIPKTPHSVHKQGITKILAISDPLQHNKQDVVTIDLEILTGRTHQIRYHLSQHGLPILGDYLYGKNEDIDMQLTAYALMFLDLDGEVKSISIS